MPEEMDLERRLASLRSWRVTGPDPEGWGVVRAKATRRQRRFRIVAALASVACVALAGSLVATTIDDGDDALEVRVGEPPATTTSTSEADVDPPTGAFDHLGPGWHELDTEPVPPAFASLTWTGSELVVLAGGPVFAYEPRTAAWRELGSAPFGEEGYGAIEWIGDRLLAVTDDGSQSATFDPDSGAWSQHGPVPNAFESRQLDVRGPDGPNFRVSLTWTGEAAIDATHGAVFDPADDTWSELPLPDDLLAFTHLLYANPVWDGHELVMGYPHAAPGLAYDAAGTEFRIFDGLDASIPTTTAIGHGLAARLGDEVLFVREGGLTATFDSRASSWEVLPPVPGVQEIVGCPSYIASLGDSAVVAPCYETAPVHLVDRQWVPVDGYDPDGQCCIGLWLGVEGALVVWSSDTDTINNPEAPYVEAHVWVPPSD